MPTLLGSVRRLVFTPSLADVTFKKRGFPVEPSAETERLEHIPQTVICGFEWAIDTHDQWELERRLSVVEPELRGFAYEGATMAFTVLDAFGGHRTRDLLLGPGEPHLFLTYIGIGFAMARLPKARWRKVVPDMPQSTYHPTMSWLAVDGYAFDRAYFDTRRWVERQYVPKPYPWAGAPDYFPRACDQGIGRALWFIHGGRVPQVAAAVQRFAEHRRPDLWSGVGLAATFAGGCDPEELTRLAKAADEHRAELGLGAVLAVKARDYAGYVPAHSADAARVLGDVGVRDAVAIADDTAAAGDMQGSTPSYEIWRRRIRAHF
jgi:hypothetical protein